MVLEDKANPISVGSYGWGGAAGTVAWVNPARKMRGTIMVNYFPGDKWPVRDETLKALTVRHGAIWFQPIAVEFSMPGHNVGEPLDRRMR